MFLIFKFFFAGILVAKTEAIVLGKATTIEEYPFVAALLRDGSQFCDGSIFNKNWILTAAHCVADANNDPVSTTSLKVKVGSTTISGTLGQVVSVVLIKVHPLRDSATNDYDVAMLKLATPLEYNNAVNFIPIINYAVPDDSDAIVLGWGAINPGIGLITSDTLKKLKVPIVNHDKCNFEYLGDITDRMICAGYLLGIADSCNGDSGGPMIFDDKQIGIVSFGRGCGLPLSPGVYSDTFVLRQFIFDIGGTQY